METKSRCQARATAPPPSATPTTHPSLPGAFRSQYAVEEADDDYRWRAHIKVDHDRGNPFLLGRLRQFITQLARMTGGRVTRADVVDARVYRTRKGHHLRVWFRPERPRLPAEVVLAMQAVLGDDPTRVKMNEGRVARGEVNWNVLWTKKYVNGLLVSHEELDEEKTDKVRAAFCRQREVERKQT